MSILSATLLVIPDFLTSLKWLIYEIEVATYNVGFGFPLFIGIQTSSCTNMLYLGFCRDADYDFSMGACLHALHSSCPGYVVESTAADIVNVLQRAVKASKSAELQVRGPTWLTQVLCILHSTNRYFFSGCDVHRIQENNWTLLYSSMETRNLSEIALLAKTLQQTDWMHSSGYQQIWSRLLYSWWW